LMANFSASTTDISLGGSIDFTDNSFGNIVSWSWTFEGGTPATSTQQNPENITYNEIGDFSVSLTITDGDGNSETLTREDYIHVTESYNMQDGTITTCNALFYDNGGPNNNYSDRKEYKLTFMPATEGRMLEVVFEEFSLESGYDFLDIYDGTSTSAPHIGQYSGNDSPGTITATNNEGALTFYFSSDYGVNMPGWKAIVRCIGDDSVSEEDLAASIYPNPNNGSFTIRVNGECSYQLFNSIGQQVLSGDFTDETQIKAEGLHQGMYFLQLTDGQGTRVEKLVIEK